MSDLLKIYKAVKNDDDFRARVEVACSLEIVEFSEDMLIHVAKSVVEGIELGDYGAVSTSAVEDESIIVAVKEIAKNAATEDEDKEGESE